MGGAGARPGIRRQAHLTRDFTATIGHSPPARIHQGRSRQPGAISRGDEAVDRADEVIAHVKRPAGTRARASEGRSQESCRPRSGTRRPGVTAVVRVCLSRRSRAQSTDGACCGWRFRSRHGDHGHAPTTARGLMPSRRWCKRPRCGRESPTSSAPAPPVQMVPPGLVNRVGHQRGLGQATRPAALSGPGRSMASPGPGPDRDPAPNSSSGGCWTRPRRPGRSALYAM